MTRPPAAVSPDDTAIDRRTRAGLILYTVSALLLITGVFMISGVVVAWIYDEAETMRGFVAAVVITLLIGVSGFLAFRRHRDASLLTRDGFLVVVLSWLVGSAFGALHRRAHADALGSARPHEMKYLVHPQGIFTLKIGDRPVKKDILYPVAVFFFLYITLVMVTALIVAASGQDLVTAITTGLATVGNIGPGFGAIGPSDNYAHYPDLVKWWLSFAMLTGRLEVYSVLVLLIPAFWRR